MKTRETPISRKLHRIQQAFPMADRTGTGAVEAVRVSDPELAFESINVRLFGEVVRDGA